MSMELRSTILLTNTTKKNTKCLFVCINHSLNEDQIADFKKSFLKEGENLEIVQLKDVHPELAKQFKDIPPNWKLAERQELAANIVSEVWKSGATHVVAMGEPITVHWINLMNLGLAGNLNGKIEIYRYENPTIVYSSLDKVNYGLSERSLGLPKSIISTTKRDSVDQRMSDGSIKKTSKFKHIAWVELH